MAEDEETATARYIASNVSTQLMLKTMFEIIATMADDPDGYRVDILSSRRVTSRNRRLTLGLGATSPMIISVKSSRGTYKSGRLDQIERAFREIFSTVAHL